MKRKRGLFGPPPRPFGQRRTVSPEDLDDALQRISPRAWLEDHDEMAERLARKERDNE
ncbi:MAG: hypothetical protein V3U27_21445 [Candidatus Tectomicrobia bacterium]